MQERGLATRELPAHDERREAPRQAATLVVRQHADPAHLAQWRRVHALARHRDEPPALDHAVELAHLEGALGEGARPPELGERHHVGYVLSIEPHGIEPGIGLRSAAAPDHGAHRRVQVDAPSCGRVAAPVGAVETLARAAEGRKRGEIRRRRIRIADERRVARCESSDAVGARRQVRLRADERAPEDVVELQGIHVARNGI